MDAAHPFPPPGDDPDPILPDDFFSF